MLKRLLFGLVGLLLILSSVVLVRTVRMSYDPSGVNPVWRPDVDETAIFDRLSRAVQLPTVTY